MYCDMHAHSRIHNIFIYGCENKRNSEKKLTEQVFPLMMHKNAADKVMDFSKPSLKQKNRGGKKSISFYNQSIFTQLQKRDFYLNSIPFDSIIIVIIIFISFFFFFVAVCIQFSFENCKFKIQRSKEGTGRIVVWMLGITNSYTLEASFGGSTLGNRKGTLFNTMVSQNPAKIYTFNKENGRKVDVEHKTLPKHSSITNNSILFYGITKNYIHR